MSLPSLHRWIQGLALMLTCTIASAQDIAHDINADGQVNTADIVAVYGYIINGGGDKPRDTFDVNSDGQVNSADIVAIYSYIINGLTMPTCYIETPGGIAVTSKLEYLDGTSIHIVDQYGNTALASDISIKGHGNSTWSADKKPYTIKFKTKTAVLGMPKDKTWVLLANYYDHTLMRNDIAFYMGREMSTLDWTPHAVFVNLVINGEYKGIYQLSEKPKIATNRVNAGAEGFLVEVDYKPNSKDITFRTDYIRLPFTIKDPDVATGDTTYNYIQHYISTTEKAIYARYDSPEQNDWRQYIDEDSFMEWYLITEIARNADSQFFSSCYMSLKDGDKLKMGPLWDFDIAFGGYPWQPEADSYNKTEDFYIKAARWYQRLLRDEAFAARVRERFSYYYDNRQKIYDKMRQDALLLKHHIAEDNKLWGTICDKDADERTVIEAYDQAVAYMMQWLEERFQWLHHHIYEL